MTTTAPLTSADPPRVGVLDRTVALGLAETEYARFLAAARALRPADWERPTECPGWNVHALVSHVLGMTEFSASLVEQAKQLRRAMAGPGVFIDKLTALQVDKHRGDTPDQLLVRMAARAPHAVKGRRRTPAFVRRRTLPVPQQVGGVMEDWTFGYLVDVILTRDTWMHRLDLSRAVSAVPELSAAHDGVLVADIVTEWAGRHGQPCRLTLTGPAGGAWSWGTGGAVLELDAVEFCRLVSGRGDGVGLLAVQVPF